MRNEDIQVIPDSKKSIGQSFNWKHEDIKRIVIGKNLSSINAEAFLELIELKEIVISEDNEYFIVKDNVIFSIDGKKLVYALPVVKGKYIIPDGVEVICAYAFCYRSNITSVVIPNSVKKIKKRAFFGCHQITTIVIPDSVEEIGDEAFYRNSGNWLEAYKDISIDVDVIKKRGRGIFDFPQKTPLFYPKFPISMADNYEVGLRLAIGFCLNRDSYSDVYAKDYERFVKSQKDYILEYAKRIKVKGLVKEIKDYYERLIDEESSQMLLCQGHKNMTRKQDWIYKKNRTH